MSVTTFQALRTHRTDTGCRSMLETLQPSDLTAGEVLVRTQWAGVNYKDSLAVTGRASVLKGSPRIAGIELVGIVQGGTSPHYEPGDAVVVHGFETGIAYDGCFSEIARVPSAHLMRLPEGLQPYEAAVIGVPGFTVAIALERFESLGLTPASGPVAISGATGAVGMIAISMLSRLGYHVVALTRREDSSDRLRALGAADVLSTSGLAAQARPLEKARFAAAIDNVGGETLSWLLRSMQAEGLLASVGNASGIDFTANVLPFIMRQVQIFGVVANAPWTVRNRLWQRLSTDWKPDMARIEPHVQHVRLQDLAAHCLQQVEGATSGRTLVAYS